MANITEILGTDSVSSSRPVINTNFELLNDELATITAYLDPTTGILSGLINATTQAINIASGTPIASIDINGANFEVDAAFNGALTINEKLVKSSIVGTPAAPTTSNAPVSIEAATYFVNANFAIPAGLDGQEVTLINRASGAISILPGSGASLSVTAISLDGLNATVTLRCFNTLWFVIGSHNTTIS
jgi:hypothetical protein